MNPILMVCANALTAPRASTSAAANANNFFIISLPRRTTRLGQRLLPGPVVHGALESGARLDQSPSQGPLVGVIEALAGVGLGRRIQKAGQLELLFVEQAARFLDQVTGVAPGVLVDRLGRAGFRPEHRGERRAVELVPRSLAPRRL